MLFYKLFYFLEFVGNHDLMSFLCYLGAVGSLSRSLHEKVSASLSALLYNIAAFDKRRHGNILNNKREQLRQIRGFV